MNKDLHDKILEAINDKSNNECVNNMYENMTEEKRQWFDQQDRLLINEFVKGFWREEMEQEFYVVAKAFLEQEYAKLKEYCSYVDIPYLATTMDETLQTIILRIMVNAAAQENLLAKKMIIMLYKEYHKKEYNQIKRCSRISRDEIKAIAKDSVVGEAMIKDISRVWVMCYIMGIEFKEDCAGIVEPFADKRVRRERKVKWKEPEKQKVKETICELFGDELTFRSELRAAKKKVNTMLEWLYCPYKGYTEDNEIEEYMICVVMTYDVLKELTPDRHYRQQELIYITLMVSGINALCKGLWDQKVEFCKMLGVTYDVLDVSNCGKVDPKKIEDIIAETKDVNKRPRVIKEECEPVKSFEDERARGDNFKQEIDRLKNELHMMKTAKRQLRCELSQKEAEIKKLRTENSEMENMRLELGKLRSFVYSMTENSICEDEIDNIEKIECLNDKRIVIVGGREKWINKLKKRFPDWKYVLPGTTGNMDLSMLTNVDKVYFFTDVLAHRDYNKLVSYLREQKIEWGYIKRVNIEEVITYIYGDLFD